MLIGCVLMWWVDRVCVDRVCVRGCCYLVGKVNMDQATTAHTAPDAPSPDTNYPL